MGLRSHGFPEFVACLAQPEVGLHELAQCLRLLGLLLGLRHVLAKPGLSQDHSRFLADGRQRACNPRSLSESGAVSANRALAALSGLCGWAIEQEHISGTNPTLVQPIPKR